MELYEHSRQLLLQVKLQQPTEETTAVLAGWPLSRLRSELAADDCKKAFWINVYNAFFLILRRDQGMQKPAVFRERCIVVAGDRFSLDEIEHGILRRCRWKWSLGYLPDPLARPLVRSLAVSATDPRIHFALNCGAKSCPPIGFYHPDRLDQQLDLATASFLESETEIDETSGEVRVTRLFLWYGGDFGGRKGIRRLLEKYLHARTTGKTLVFRPYDRSEVLEDVWRPSAH